jgi:hypothetical protein
MIDTHDIRRDPRRLAAMETDDGSSRGWDFRPSDEPPMWFRAVAEVLRPRSLIILAVLAGVISLWFL